MKGVWLLSTCILRERGWNLGRCIWLIFLSILGTLVEEVMGSGGRTYGGGAGGDEEARLFEEGLGCG